LLRELNSLRPASGEFPNLVREVYGVADRRLGGGWILGERYSIADIHLFRIYWRMFNSLRPASGEFPNLDAHYARMMARPAVKKTIEIETAVGYELPA
jgi:glutathione S-transferase